MEVVVERMKELGLTPSKPVTPSDAPILNCALKYLEGLQKNSSNADIAKDSGLDPNTVGTYRSLCIKYGIIERKKERPRRLEDPRKLRKMSSHGRIYYVCPHLNQRIMELAGLDPGGNYFYIISPENKQFTIKIFNQEEADAYKASQT